MTPETQVPKLLSNADYKEMAKILKRAGLTSDPNVVAEMAYAIKIGNPLFDPMMLAKAVYNIKW